MLSVTAVKTSKDRREFIEFPLKLYKDNPCFVPPLYSDERKIFRRDYVYNDCCDAVYFLARRDGKTVGRISGILQKAANEKNGERRVRFTRFDTVDDAEVARALFNTVEDWARSIGMDTVCGPLGFSDLEREGLLIEGFDRQSTFEEQYNAPYYADLIEKCGYEKEVDWFESQLRAPSEEDIALAEKSAALAAKRFGLHFGEAKNINDFIDRYADDFFRLIDLSYGDIYGTVPFTDGMKKITIDNFRLLLDLRFVRVILNEEGRMVCFGLCLPAIGEAVRKSGGRLTPAALVKLLRARRKPRVIDLALVGVDPEYSNRGISIMLMAGLMRMLKEDGVEYAETNLNLEDNYAIRNMWKRFDATEHKKRRAYVKRLTPAGGTENDNE